MTFRQLIKSNEYWSDKTKLNVFMHDGTTCNFLSEMPINMILRFYGDHYVYTFNLGSVSLSSTKKVHHPTFLDLYLNDIWKSDQRLKLILLTSDDKPITILFGYANIARDVFAENKVKDYGPDFVKLYVKEVLPKESE